MVKLVSKKSLNFFLGSIRKFPGNSLMEPGSDTLGCIRQFPGNFLMHPLYSHIWIICELPILILSPQGGCIRKFPRNFLMQAGVSDPGPIREFPGNFLMEPRKKFKPFF